MQSSLLRASKETLNLWRDRKARLILIADFLLVVGSGITWLAVPWFLIQEPNGNAVYGLSSSALTLLIFLLLPFLGKAIDRNSRKKVLLGYLWRTENINGSNRGCCRFEPFMFSVRYN